MTAIDWNVQLKKIERQFDGLPTPPTQAELRVQREHERRAQILKLKREEIFGAASRVGLVLSLSVAMNAWPYSRACGDGLLAYLIAAGAIVAGGIWAVVGTWHSRAPRLHAAAFVGIMWGVILITAQVLPRVGYAKIDPNPQNRPTWRCHGTGQTSVGMPVIGRFFKWGPR